MHEVKNNKHSQMSKFTDRESGIFGGLMLSLREYRDRMEVHRGYKLNKKPREMDCLIIDTLDQTEPMDNDYLEQVIKYGIYDEVNRILTKVREDTDMYEKLMEIFREDMKDDLDKKYNEGKAEGKAERDKLKAENKRLKKELKEMKMKMAAQS